MRVLLVLGEHNYGVAARGLAIEYAAFGSALRNLGHEVLHLESWDRTAWRDFAELNSALLETVIEKAPDAVVIVPLLYEVWLETLDLIRACSRCAVIVWTTDDSWKYRQSSRFYGKRCDLITTTYAARLPDYEADGIGQVMLTQWAADSLRLRAPRPAAECDIDVSFVGTSHGDRRARIEALQQSGFRVECFGAGWPNGTVTPERMDDLFRRSRVSLNFANSYGMNQIKARTFEVPGAGGFLLTEHAEGLELLYRLGEEVLAFRGRDDLVKQLRWVLDHPLERDRIARAGHARTVAEHTYEARWRAILAVAAERAGARMPRTSAQEAAATLARLAARHRSGRFARRLAEAASWPFVCLWGRQRGPRAARRAFFELMWRLEGERAFCAAGWPGRLFYRES